MKCKVFIPALLWLFVLSGCTVYSLHPLYSDEVLIYDPALEGSWADTDSGAWNIRRALQPDDNKVEQQTMDERTYILSYDEKGKTVELYIHLMRLGNQLFLDYYPTEDYDKAIGNDLLAGNLLPVHTFAKVEIGEGELKIHRFNGDWLEDLIESRRIKIAYEEVPFYGGTLKVLTASTEELQKFVIKYMNEKEAFEEPDTLTEKL